MFAHTYFPARYFAPAFFPPALSAPVVDEIDLGAHLRRARRPQPYIERPRPSVPPVIAPVIPELPAVLRTYRIATQPAIFTAEPSPITIEDSGPVRAATEEVARRHLINQNNAALILLLS